MAKQPITLEDVKTKIKTTVNKTGFTTYGSKDNFSYDPNKVIKCEFNLVLDHYLWGKFSELAEELSTSPTMLMYLLMEQSLLTTGKIQESWKTEDTDGSVSDPIIVQVKDLQKDKNGEFLSLGQNRILGIAEDKKPTKRNGLKSQYSKSNDDEEDEDSNLEMNFLAELS